MARVILNNLDQAHGVYRSEEYGRLVRYWVKAESRGSAVFRGLLNVSESELSSADEDKQLHNSLIFSQSLIISF